MSEVDDTRTFLRTCAKRENELIREYSRVAGLNG